VSKTYGVDDSVTVITGATDGIGLALAKRYEQSGDRLVLVGRRPLESLQGPLSGPTTYCQADLRDPAVHVPIEMFLCEQAINRIDRLILNAATGYYGPTADQLSSSVRDTINVNLRSAIGLIHTCYPALRAAGGTVVLIGSIVAAMPCPGYSVYGATKAAIDGLGWSLRHELAPHVSLKVVHPGATKLGLHAKIGVDPEAVDWSRFPPAERVAASIAQRIDRNGWRHLLAPAERCLWMLGRTFPHVVDAVVAR